MDWLQSNNRMKQICITGGKAKLLQQLLSDAYTIVELNEFEAYSCRCTIHIKKKKNIL